MSADWSKVSLWTCAPLDQAVLALRTTIDQLVDLGQDTFDQPLGRWEGAAAVLAGVQYALLKESLEDQIAELSAARQALQDAADQIAGVERVVARAQDFAATNDLWIAGDGTVHDDHGVRILEAGATGNEAEAALADRRTTINEGQALVDEAVRRAATIDTDLTSVLISISDDQVARNARDGFDQAATTGAQAGELADLYPPPQDDATPEQNKAWWAALTGTERAAVRDQHPEWIANRNGISANLRDEANRKLLAQYREQYEAEFRTYTQSGKSTYGFSAVSHYNWLSTEVLPALDTLDTIAALKDRHILGLAIQPGKNVQAIVAVGDIDTADNVAVFTPGFTTTAAKLGSYDEHMRALGKQSLSISKRNNGVESDPTVAAVTWLGYQAPQWDTIATSNSVVSDHTAKTAGADLADFYDGINVSRTSDPHLVALGHSYGSAVTGAALTKEVGVDDAVVFGSPGLPISNVDEIKLSGNLYNEQADGDWLVGNSSATGFDPNYMAGTIQLDTDAALDSDGDPLLASHGHSEYLNDKTTSQNNLAAITAAHPEQAITQR